LEQKHLRLDFKDIFVISSCFFKIIMWSHEWFDVLINNKKVDILFFVHAYEPLGSSDDECDGSRKRKINFLDVLHFLTTGTTMFGSACDMNIFYLSAVGFLIFSLSFLVSVFGLTTFHNIPSIYFFLGFDHYSFNCFYFYLNQFIE